MRVNDRSLGSIAILLCTMQGQRYLHEQLDSIVQQTYTNWTIWVSDDGSADDTQAILAQYQTKLDQHGFRFTVVQLKALLPTFYHSPAKRASRQTTMPSLIKTTFGSRTS